MNLPMICWSSPAGLQTVILLPEEMTELVAELARALSLLSDQKIRESEAFERHVRESPTSGL